VKTFPTSIGLNIDIALDKNDKDITSMKMLTPNYKDIKWEKDDFGCIFVKDVIEWGKIYAPKTPPSLEDSPWIELLIEYETYSLNNDYIAYDINCLNTLDVKSRSSSVIYIQCEKYNFNIALKDEDISVNSIKDKNAPLNVMLEMEPFDRAPIILNCTPQELVLLSWKLSGKIFKNRCLKADELINVLGF
jgi:hypothetical protein